ncbi:MAG: BREX-4 system phosphatase PglZ, partial [Ruminococcus flavefaciens]|nr:BREX-4 system phosphatase PglZ [Ruminococcus flavefaciens]
LVTIIIKEGSFDAACCTTLAINKYSPSLFSQWSRLSAFQKWMLWIWTRLQAYKSYVVECSRDCKNLTEFVDALYCRIISYMCAENFEKYYLERKALLSTMQTVPTDRFWSKISALNAIDALSCLTCLTDIERKTIFEIIAGIEYQDRNTILPVLKRVYPQLYYYLQNDTNPNKAKLSPAHEQYFSEYKWLKVTDTLTEKFISKVEKIAEEKGSSVFEMQSRNHYVTTHYDEQTSILFVDGMGIEYADYLAHLFSDLSEQQYSVTVEAGFCSLPSITEINKDFMDGRNTVEPPVRELDTLKHSNVAHPESFIKQLSIWDELKSRVLGLLVGNTHKIIITADHGTSRMAVKIRNTKFDNVLPKPENVEIYKYGRFCKGIQDESSYPTAVSVNDKLIFADYTRFAQSGAPIDEIHGGASLEEWIVPIVTIEKYTVERIPNVVVTPATTKYRPELGTKQVKVIFSISGIERKSVMAKIKGDSFKCTWEGGTYSFVFTPLRGDTMLNVKIVDGCILGQFDIQIDHGIKKNTNFDI